MPSYGVKGALGFPSVYSHEPPVYRSRRRRGQDHYEQFLEEERRRLAIQEIQEREHERARAFEARRDQQLLEQREQEVARDLRRLRIKREEDVRDASLREERHRRRQIIMEEEDAMDANAEIQLKTRQLKREEEQAAQLAKEQQQDDAWSEEKRQREEALRSQRECEENASMQAESSRLAHELFLESEGRRLRRPSISWSIASSTDNEDLPEGEVENPSPEWTPVQITRRTKRKHKLLASPIPHKPLTKDVPKIRLLTLKPERDFRKPLYCSIRVFKLSEAVKKGYETISYVWGQNDDKGRIEIRDPFTGRGIVCAIPNSAEEALRTVRRADSEDRLLWIDSICINQNDTREKEEQIRIMGDIYASSKCLLIWLGQAGSGSNANIASAIQGIRALSDHMVNLGSKREVMNALYPHEAGPRRDVELPSVIDAETLENLKTFFLAPWFTRLWVIQEAALSRHGVCYRGRAVVDLAEVLRAAMWLMRTHEVASSHRGIKNAAAVWAHADDKFGIYTNRRHYCDASSGKRREAVLRETATIGALLCNFMDFEATEPKDKVFGLLGLSQWSARGDDLPSLLQPDYSKTVVEVFRDATRQAAARNLNVFEKIFRRESDFDVYGRPREMPSWVPQWDRLFSETVDAYPLARFFAADDHRAPHSLTQVADNGNKLEVEVIDDGTIMLSSDVMDPSYFSSVDSACRLLRDKILPLYYRFTSTSRTTNARLELVSSLVGGTIREQALSAQDHRFRAEWNAFQQYLGDDSNLPLRTPHVFQGDEANKAAAASFLEAMYHTCVNRRFFITSAGRMGVGPSMLQADDHTYVLLGARWLFVLRSLPDSFHYSLLGPCYVHGRMNGEVLREKAPRGTDRLTETLTLV